MNHFLFVSFRFNRETIIGIYFRNRDSKLLQFAQELNRHLDLNWKEKSLANENLRNFCIIAHIDHGKSTLADRLIEATKTVQERDMKAQLLDSMDLERERGITIKMQAVRIEYKANDNETYLLNLIDTPGHVDFSYEVSRSLAACEGALLLIDATQGIEAQTLANFYLALEQDLEIIPVINKIDLPSADPDKVLADVEQVLGIPQEEAVLCSAKTGIGVSDILEAIVKQIPCPKPIEADGPKALIYDAHYDAYRGVISYVRLKHGTLQKGQRIKMMSTGKVFDVLELGFFKPKMTPVNELKCGEVGYLISNIKVMEDARVGDTITDSKKSATTPFQVIMKQNLWSFVVFILWIRIYLQI